MTLRFGIVGTGNISRRFTVAARAAGMTVGAVYSRTEERGSAFAAACGIPAVYTDYAAMLASPAVDAVYLASPNACHAAGAIAALRAGKHVLCEKPAAVSGAEWAAMCAAARAAERVLMEAMRPVHDPALCFVREQLPRLGKLRQVSLSYCQYSSRYDAFRTGEVKNAFNPSLGNAALMDIGVYAAAVSAALFGAPQAVSARSVFLPGGFEGCGNALLSYDGFTVSLAYSKIHDSPAPSVFLGEEGALSLDRLNPTRRLSVLLRGGREEVLPFVPTEENMVHEILAFSNLVAEGAVEHPYLAVTRDTLAVLDAVRAAAGIRFD